MKKITLVTMQLKTPGGIERLISTLAEMFADDYEVEIVANYGRPTDPLAFPLPKNIKVTFLDSTKPQEISLKNIITSLKWHQIPSELKRRYIINSKRHQTFKKYFQNLKTDYIITDRALYNSLVTKYYLGPATLIATDHNDPHGNSKYVNELLTSIKKFHYLVVATEDLKKIYTPKTNVKCIVIPNPLPNIPTKKSPLNTQNILSVGRLVPDKDFPLLINTISVVHQKNPNIHLTIIGDGAEKTKLQKQIKSLHLENVISFAGWLSQKQIEKYYYRSSLFVMTSHNEAFGLALAEAMSYGVPCLALSRASGARAQITKNTGVLINDTNPQIIADKIISIMNAPKKLKTFQTAINQEIEKKYGIKTIKKAWGKLLSP